MVRVTLAAVLLCVGAVGMPRAQAPAQGHSLTGRWSLDRAASQFPPDVGFDVDWAPGSAAGGATSAGGRGRRSSGGGSAAPFSGRRESVDDATRLKQLTEEVRTPPALLTIIDTPSAVTVTTGDGSSRTFHPSGREETLQLGTVPLPVVARRDADRLVVQYSVEQGRELRYTYARDAGGRLTIDVQFVERGGGDHVLRVYDAAADTDEAAAPPTQPERVPAAPPERGSVPAGGASQPGANPQPGGDLRGLTKLGVVVEGLTPQAAACGLTEAAVQAAVVKRLTDTGLTVSRNTDEPTYIYVSVMTSSLPDRLCVSRYDVFLNTNTSATLAYQQSPALVTATLLHKGGLAGGSAAAHADAVLKGVEGYVDGFVTRIRDANGR
jgi:hypothetical protein